MLGEVLGNMPNIVVNTITTHYVLVRIFLSHFLSHSLSVAQNMLNIQVVKKVRWCCQRDSNTRPHPYQGCALPLELWQHCGEIYNIRQWFASRIESSPDPAFSAMLAKIGELVFACPGRILHAFWCSKGTLGYAPRCRRASDASEGQYLVQAGDFVDI